MIFKSVFKTLPKPTRPFCYTLLNALWKHGKRAALIDPQSKAHVTYHDLYLQSLSVSAFLKHQQFHHGNVASTVMHNCSQFLPIFLGTALRGGTFSPASNSYNEREVEYQLKDSKSNMVYCHEMNFEKVYSAADKCADLKSIVVVPDHTSKLRDGYPSGVIHFEDVLAYQPDLNISEIDVDVDREPLILPYSSGTTGPPKGVMLSNTNVSMQVDIVGSHFEEQILTKIDPNYNFHKETNIMFLPLYHIYGFCMFMSNIVQGVPTVLMTRFDSELFCKSVEQYRPRFMQVVPPIMVFFSKHPIVEKYDLSSLETLIVAAAPVGKELCEDVMKRLPNLKSVGQGFGMTETTAAVHIMVHGEHKFDSIGKLCANHEMKFVDPETGRDLGANEKGELCVKGPCIMLGYLNRPQATADTIDDDGWMHTGDIGYVDDDGFAYIVDRLKELIKVKGLQVPPAELEDLLLTHPSIQDAAVIGIPDESSGEVPMAFVVRKDESLKEHEIVDYVKERVAKYKQLAGGVQFIREIPKSPSGKILRRFLRDEAKLLKEKCV